MIRARGGQPVYPTADQVALAVVTACRLTREDPLTIAVSKKMRARPHVLAALRVVYTQADLRPIARCCGYGGKDPAATAGAALRVSRLAASWSEDLVDEVVGVLVAEDYGRQAE